MIRLATIDSGERGLLMRTVRDEIRMTLTFATKHSWSPQSVILIKGQLIIFFNSIYCCKK